VHVTSAGTGPTLVLLHQSPLSASQFLPAFGPLVAAGLRVVALDTPGFGASDPPPAPVSIVDHAEALLAVLAAVADGPVHLLGHHTGAMIGAALAARHPAALATLILNGVPLFDDAERAFFATFRFAPVEPRADGGHLVDAWQQRLKASPGLCPVSGETEKKFVPRRQESDKGSPYGKQLRPRPFNPDRSTP